MPYPEIGQPLRRAAEAHVLPEKWRGWILAAHGHGPEWARVFRVELTDSEMVWQAIASAVLDAPVSTAVIGGPHGIVCCVLVKLSINYRTASVATAWHTLMTWQHHVWLPPTRARSMNTWP